MKNKKKYKFNSGIQQIAMDTPDYDKAYNLQAEENAKRQGITQGLGAVSGAYKSFADVGSMAGSVIKNRAKNKERGYTLGSAVEMGSAGAAAGGNIGQKFGGPIGLAIGAGVGALAGGIYGATKGKKEYIKGKKLQEEAEKKTAWDNYFKGYNPNGSETDAQAMLAKKGKYKLRAGTSTFKQPRMIETEGREPIFSPKKSDGTRDLLYYNPNDPTHEEGGVKAMVIPKAADGKKKTKVEKKPEPLIDTDSWAENIGEVFDPTGLSSWDDAYRALKNLKNNPKEIGSYTVAGTEILGAVPLVGKLKYLAKGASAAKKLKQAGKFAKISDRIGDITNIGQSILGDQLSEEGYNPVKGTYKGRNIAPQFFDKETVGMGMGAFQVGTKQIKVNDLNNTAFSQNLSNTPSPNAPNAFFQPQAKINQVAKQLPEKRRKEKIGIPKSQKMENPFDKMRHKIKPPIPYEMLPPPPRSTFNTKNDFKKGGKYVKTYQIGTQGTEADATYKHTKTFKSKPAYQAALQAHDDSLNLYSQSRYFTDLVKGSGLYNSTVENPEVKNITRSGLGRAQSPLKAYGAPNEYTEEIMSVAGMNPMRKDLYSRKESQYKSFKEHEEAKASGKPHGTHEGYEINMYKHPEMALNFQPDTAKTIQPKRAKFKTPNDNSTTAKTPVRTIQTPTKETVADTSKTKTTPVVKTTPTRNRFLGKEKTGLQKLADKANNLIGKVGSSSRKSNGKTVRVFK
jgi:uncharacterized protein YcfJ